MCICIEIAIPETEKFRLQCGTFSTKYCFFIFQSEFRKNLGSDRESDKTVWRYGKCLRYSSNRTSISAAVDFWAIFEYVENRENRSGLELATSYRRSGKRYDEVVAPALVGLKETYKTPHSTSLRNSQLRSTTGANATEVRKWPGFEPRYLEFGNEFRKNLKNTPRHFRRQHVCEFWTEMPFRQRRKTGSTTNPKRAGDVGVVEHHPNTEFDLPRSNGSGDTRGQSFEISTPHHEEKVSKCAMTSQTRVEMTQTRVPTARHANRTENVFLANFRKIDSTLRLRGRQIGKLRDRVGRTLQHEQHIGLNQYKFILYMHTRTCMNVSTKHAQFFNQK